MVRWTAAGTLIAAFLLVGLPGWTQDQAAGDKKLEFKFRDASVDKVLEYVCKQMGWVLTYSEKAKAEGTITAYNDSPVPEGKVVDFLNTSLQKAKVQVYLYEGVLKVLTEEEAKPFVERALEAGINFFDTADVYSLGESEKVTGNLLRQLGVRREDVVVDRGGRKREDVGLGARDHGASSVRSASK